MPHRILFFSALFCLFFSRSFAQTPEYTEWVGKGNELYEAKKYKESAMAYSRAFASIGGKAIPSDRYNAACSWSLAGDKDSAFSHLNSLATKANYKNYNHLVTDTDLDNLHNDARWKTLCEQVKQNKEKAEEHLNKQLVATLDTIYQTDQQSRQQVGSVQSKYGNDSKEMKELWKTMGFHDSLNLIKVVAILDKYGWPGPEIVGDQGSTTVFLVIQHADIKTQEKYLPLMREAVKAKKAQPSSLALLEDRVALRQGKKQTYGSQVYSDAQGQYLAPMTDPDNVDKRRAEVGLGPLAGYLQSFGLTWDVEAYKKELPQLEARKKKIEE